MIAPLDGAALRASLAAPSNALDITALAAIWRVATVSVLIEGDFTGLSGADVARKVRGTLWPVLCADGSEAAKAGGPCDRAPVCLLDLLWNDMGALERGRRVPKPFALRGHVDHASGGQRGFVQMALFGLAAARADEALAVIVRALKDAPGIATRGRRWRAVDARLDDETGVDPAPAGVVAAELTWMTPLQLDRSGAPAEDWSALWPSLIGRVEGLARWHGARLVADVPALFAAGRRLGLDDGEVAIRAWARASTRSGGVIPMRDLAGRLRLVGPLDPLAPYLLIGETTHLGKDTTHGHGAYRLALGVAG